MSNRSAVFLFAFILCCFGLIAVLGQDAEQPIPPEIPLPSVPAPTPGVALAAEPGPAEQITIDDGSAVTVKTRGGKGPRVLLRANHIATVVLRYGTNYAGSALFAQALDGGTVNFPGNRRVVAPSGTVVLQFSSATLPGLYRILLNCGGTATTLRFWVPAPESSTIDPTTIVPEPILSATPLPISN